MSSKALRQVLIGLETAPGTYVPVTIALRAKASLKAVVDKVVPDEDIGSFAPARHYIGSLKAEGKLEVDGYFEDARHPLQMALGASVRTGSGPSSYIYTMTLPEATAPTFSTYTMEYFDGSNHCIKASDVFGTGVEIAGEAGKSWMINTDIVGGQTTLPGGITAVVAPVAATSIRMADTILTIDDTWGNLGNTTMAQLISFSWKLENLQHQKLFAGVLWPSGRGNDKWKATLEMIVECENSTIHTEVAKLLTTTQSAIRIKALNGTKYAQIDGMYMLNDVDTLDDRDGNNILKLTYLAEQDSSNNTPQVIIGMVA